MRFQYIIVSRKNDVPDVIYVSYVCSNDVHVSRQLLAT